MFLILASLFHIKRLNGALPIFAVEVGPRIGLPSLAVNALDSFVLEKLLASIESATIFHDGFHVFHEFLLLRVRDA